MSSTLRSFVFIAVYFSGYSAAFSGSLIPQHVTGFVTTATPPRPAIDLIGIGPQKFAQPPHADFISPDYAAWPPLDQLNDRLGPAHLPHDLMGIGPEIFPTPGQAPHAESIAPEHAAWPPLDQLNDRLGPAHLPHDLMGIGPEIFPTRGQPPHADSPARPPLDALADSEDSNSFWSYKKTPNGNIIAHYPEDFPLPLNLGAIENSSQTLQMISPLPPQIFRRPGLSSVYAFPAHTPPLRNFFEGRPELEEVAEKQGKALVQGKREPISSDNLASWTKQNQDYLQLKPKDQEEIRTWLQQRFFDSDPTSKTGGKAIAYIWSLQKSTGKHLVWWGKSIINAGKTDEHEFIDLVEIGDTLSFFNKRANFEILDQHAEAISKKLLKILEYDSQKNLRGDALAIPTLIDVKGRGNVSMYKARMGQLMNIHLRHFDQKDVRSKEKVLQDLYFFVGQSREKAISKATNALKKSPESFKKLLTPERGVPGQADYERIEAALNSLGKGRFF
ncbi:hypothetical protein Pst134EA_031434 [Puccinia striiformis f. sp. tritici]|uniref:uncharacterized protein n=1 Tax=Puccinia striiformis f. sp. tritici TaxID=168172 RepID=UPI0020086938|nr:uncharacterized protein Pst134EA_031434 [Puccinia striiformis f. sp. tritici]KAH9440762.1 hypothetical protein Pst134EA_031434 [Puccinia striiformis f. sp. tritici]